MEVAIETQGIYRYNIEHLIYTIITGLKVESLLYMLTAIIRKTDFLQQMMPSYGTQNAMSICFSLIVIRLV